MQELADAFVKLRQGEASDPLIFIHPIGGNLYIYKSLIAKLSTRSAIYGIQDHFVEGRYKQYETLTEQAQEYVQKVFENLNVSRLSLAGMSSGGTLAFEMARLCLEYGVQVKQLILFDTWVKAPFDSAFKQYFKKIILRQIEKLKLSHLVETEESQSAYMNFLWERMALLFPYEPKYSSVSAMLFTAKESVSEYTVDPKVHYAWQAFVDSIQILPVAGNHETILDPEYVNDLSEQINSLLK